VNARTRTFEIRVGELLDRAPNVIRLVNRLHRSSLDTSPHKTPPRMDTHQGDLEEAVVAADLTGRIRAGDPAAENELVQRYGERLRYVLRRQMSAFPHDVDDVIQESLLAAIERLRNGGLEEPARLGGFIYGIARNLRLAKLREHARHDGSVDPDLISTIPDGRQSPDGLQSSAETTRIVRRLLTELGAHRGRERDREVLFRLFLRQQRREEVCEALGISPEHLRRVVHRAKRRLKALIAESLEQNHLGVTERE